MPRVQLQSEGRHDDAQGFGARVLNFVVLGVTAIAYDRGCFVIGRQPNRLAIGRTPVASPNIPIVVFITRRV